MKNVLNTFSVDQREKLLSVCTIDSVIFSRDIIFQVIPHFLEILRLQLIKNSMIDYKSSLVETVVPGNFFFVACLFTKKMFFSAH